MEHARHWTCLCQNESNTFHIKSKLTNSNFEGLLRKKNSDFMKHIFTMTADRRKYTHQTTRMEASVEERIVAVKISIGSTTFKERSKTVSTGTWQKFLPRYTFWKKLKSLSWILIV